MQRGYHVWRVPEELRYPSLPRRHRSLGRGLILVILHVALSFFILILSSGRCKRSTMIVVRLFIFFS